MKSASPRRGPKPLLTMEQETQLAQWVLTQQSSGQRVTRNDVASKAQEMMPKDENQDQDQNETKSQTQKLGMGWCNRFMTRHPELNLRSAMTKSTISALSEDATVKFTIRETSTDSDDQVETLEISETMEDANAHMKPIKTRKYNRKHMDAAVEMFMSGTSMNEVAQRFPLLHQRTIRRRVLRVQRGEVDKRRGPRPLLEGEPEQKLVTWILDMQNKGSKVTKKDILARANEQYRALTGETGENKLKEGWLRRFKERHPVLSGRAPSSVKEGEESSSEDKLSLNGDDEESNNALVQGQQVMAIEAEEEREVQDVNASEDEEKAASSKRQKTEATGCSTNTADQQRTEGTKTMEKLDAIMQSTKRLEEMQRQQLEMLQQLCASNNMLSSIAGRKRNSGNMD